MPPPDKSCGGSSCTPGPAVASPTAIDELAPQLEHLLSSIAQHGRTHLGEVETDLLQTGYLLTEAIDKLSRSFLGIHTALTAQQSLMRKLLDGDPATPTVHEALARLQADAGAHVTAAVTGLQFQDMTSQLIGRILGHVGNLREVVVAVDSAGAALSSGKNGHAESNSTSAAAALEVLNQLLDDQNGLQRDGVRKTVAQTHMESGDIELF